MNDIKELIRQIQQLYNRIYNLTSQLEFEFEDSGYSDLARDCRVIKFHELEQLKQSIIDLNSDFLGKSTVEENYKKKSKCFVKSDAGNVPLNNQIFNNSFSGTSSETGASVGEALENNKYSYIGPIYRFDKIYGQIDTPLFTMAPTRAKAKTQLEYVIKKRLGFDPKTSKLNIDEKGIELVHEEEPKYIQKNQKVIDDPKYNYEDEDRIDDYVVENCVSKKKVSK